MDNLPFAMLLATRATRRIAHSALPGAPVVTPGTRRRPALAVRPRAALARALRVAAARLAPEPAPAGTRPATPGSARGTASGRPCVPAS